MKKFIARYLGNKMNTAFFRGIDCIARAIEKLEKDDFQILDIGCHQGKIAERILKNIPKYKLYGIDVINTQNNGQMEYTQMDMENVDLPYESDFFDVVYSNQVLEHILHKDKLLSETYRILKPGGLCIVATENIASLDNILSCLIGWGPLNQNTSIERRIDSILSPHFMDGVTSEVKSESNLEGIHIEHKNVCSYFGLQRLLQIHKFKKVTIKSFGGANYIFEKLLPIYNRVLVVCAEK